VSKHTPRLQGTDQSQTEAVQAGTEFLAGREAQIQARLDEIDRELAGLEPPPDDLTALERRAGRELQTLLDSLQPASTTAPPPQRQPPPAVETPPPRRTRIGLCQGINGIYLGLAAALILLAAGAYLFQRVAWPPVAATPVVAAATTTATPEPTLPPTASPSPLPATATPAVQPQSLSGKAGRDDGTTPELVRVASVELPLAVMTETIRLAGGSPVLQPVPPASGAGLHRTSDPFGTTGATAILVPAGSAPPDLWQARPGDTLTGCNDDETCQDYQVSAAETWLPERLHRYLSDWPQDPGVLLYTSGESGAWVIQARPNQEAKP
jgi:hypothetical protein